MKYEVMVKNYLINKGYIIESDLTIRENGSIWVSFLGRHKSEDLNFWLNIKISPLDLCQHLFSLLTVK
jgi:hypothetical protein